jgi:hypothetical protein
VWRPAIVADSEVGVRERQWAFGVERFPPQCDLGDFDREVVKVDSVDAVFDGVGGGGAQVGGAGFGVAGAGGGQHRGILRGHGEDEISAAAGWVDDGQAE